MTASALILALLSLRPGAEPAAAPAPHQLQHYLPAPSDAAPKRSSRRLPVMAVLPMAAPALAAPAASPCAPGSFLETFKDDPFGKKGRFVLDGPGDDQFEHSKGELRWRIDSSRPTTRALAPLETTVSGEDCFSFGAVFTIEAVEASPEDFFQLAISLVNSETTGANRTGTAPVFGDADTFDSVEIGYFPNLTAFGGPTLSPSIFGSEVPGGDAFFNFAGLFGPPADLGDNPSPQDKELPLGARLQAEVRHDPGTQLVTLSFLQLDGERPRVIETALIPLDVSGVTGTDTFEVDSIALTSYFDAADFDPSTVSLRADVVVHELFFQPCCSD